MLDLGSDKTETLGTLCATCDRHDLETTSEPSLTEASDPISPRRGLLGLLAPGFSRGLQKGLHQNVIVLTFHWCTTEPNCYIRSRTGVGGAGRRAGFIRLTSTNPAMN